MAGDPDPIVIPASGNAARTINVLSQPLPDLGTESATFAQSRFVVDSSQAITVGFEVEEKQ